MAGNSNSQAKTIAMVTGVVLGLVGVGLGVPHLLDDPYKRPSVALGDIDPDHLNELKAPLQQADKIMALKAALQDYVPRGSKEDRLAPLFFAPQLWQVTLKDRNAIIDIFDPNAPSIHAEVPNSWFIGNGLLADLGKGNALNLDSDGDGFSNFEEFQGNTKPNDPNSYPSLVTTERAKLEAIAVTQKRARIEVERMFAISGTTPETVGITVTQLTRKGEPTTAKVKKEYKVGDDIDVLDDAKRFKVESFGKKEFASATGKASENVVNLRDNIFPSSPVISVRGGSLIESEKDPALRRTYDVIDNRVKLRVTAGKTANTEFTVRVGESFTLPNADGSTIECTLEDVNEAQGSVNIRVKGMESPIAVPNVNAKAQRTPKKTPKN